MVAAVLQLYFIGTVITVLAVFYEIADSFGGLMYAPNSAHMLELDHRIQRQLSSSSHRRGSPAKENAGT